MLANVHMMVNWLQLLVVVEALDSPSEPCFGSYRLTPFSLTYFGGQSELPIVDSDKNPRNRVVIVGEWNIMQVRILFGQLFISNRLHWQIQRSYCANVPQGVPFASFDVAGYFQSDTF